MGLPIATHRITVLRADGLDQLDSYDPVPVYRPVARHVRAVISGASGFTRSTRAEAETIDARLACDLPASGITHLDRVQDDDSGQVWAITWLNVAKGLGLDHVSAGLVRYEGQAST